MMKRRNFLIKTADRTSDQQDFLPKKNPVSSNKIAASIKMKCKGFHGSVDMSVSNARVLSMFNNVLVVRNLKQI